MLPCCSPRSCATAMSRVTRQRYHLKPFTFINILIYSTKSWSDSCSHSDIVCHCCGRVSRAVSQVPNVPAGPAVLRPHIVTPDPVSSLSQTELECTCFFPPLDFFISATDMPGRLANTFRLFPLFCCACAATFMWLFSAQALLCFPSVVSSNSENKNNRTQATSQRRSRGSSCAGEGDKQHGQPETHLRREIRLKIDQN